MKVLLNWPLIILAPSWKISSSAALSYRVFSARYPYRSVCASQGLFWNPTGLHWENTGICIPFYFEIKHLLIRAKITQYKCVVLKFIGFPLNHCHNFCLLILCQPNEQAPREDTRLRGGSVIDLWKIVPGAEIISNRCNMEQCKANMT